MIKIYLHESHSKPIYKLYDFWLQWKLSENDWGQFQANSDINISHCYWETLQKMTMWQSKASYVGPSISVLS